MFVNVVHCLYMYTATMNAHSALLSNSRLCHQKKPHRRALIASAAKTMVSVKFYQTGAHADQRLTLSGHAAARIKDGEAIIFGGYHETPDKQRTVTNAAWIYTASSGTWTPVQYTSDAVPQPRLVSQVVVIGSKLWLIGGWNSNVTGPDAFLGDVWTLDLNTFAWEQVQLTGEPLQPISRFQAAGVGQYIYIHTHRCDDHILRLDTATNSLEKVPIKGPAPSSRGLHSMLHVKNTLYVFGGAPQKGAMLNDIWKLDLNSLQWQQLQASGLAPHERCSTAAAAVGDKLLYFGGAFCGAAGGLEMLQDVHVLDTTSNTWIVPEVLPMGAAAGVAAAGDMPSARNAVVMVPLGPSPDGGVQLLLQGGWKAFVETYNDTYLVTVQG